MGLKINNRDARRLWLWSTGLSVTPTGPLDLKAMIRDLGFVQIDTIRNVTRAHHHILWSRNQNYREKMLWPLLSKQRFLFEHFTHDASLIPMEYYPYWQRQLLRMGEKTGRSPWYQSGLGQGHIRDILERIRQEGALSTHDFDTKIEGKREMWARPPHKKALDQMWYAGVLCTTRREKFIKFYDLAERVVPDIIRRQTHSDTKQLDWLHSGAIKRLGFGTPGEIQRFWAASDAREVKTWLSGARDLVPVEIQAADGTWSPALAAPDIEVRLGTTPPPSSRLRLLNPFDPAIRDRNRLERLFGFEYRNEMFVPKNQRRWGYYVYPLLEGSRFVGRIELTADRQKGQMLVTGFWPEPRVTWGADRHGRLKAELGRFGRLAGITDVTWACPQAGA